MGADIVGKANGDEFGWSVSISDDGRTVAVGARSAAGTNGVGSGCVRVYRMNDSESEWIPMGNNIEGEAAYDYSGESVPCLRIATGLRSVLSTAITTGIPSLLTRAAAFVSQSSHKDG